MTETVLSFTLRLWPKCCLYTYLHKMKNEDGFPCTTHRYSLPLFIIGNYGFFPIFPQKVEVLLFVQNQNAPDWGNVGNS